MSRIVFRAVTRVAIFRPFIEYDTLPTFFENAMEIPNEIHTGVAVGVISKWSISGRNLVMVVVSRSNVWQS